MNSPIPSDKKLKVYDIVLIGMMVATLEAAKIALSFLPNIELVSLLIILYTLFFGRKTIFAVYTFILLEGILYGFGIWWFSYLYIWPILTFLTYRFRKHTKSLFWALLSGVYGLAFGALCAIPYVFLSGFPAAASYWIMGIPFDIAHCVGNFVLAQLLFQPLSRAFSNLHRYLQS